MQHDMRHPKPYATPEEQIAYWDNERQACIDGLVYATQQRIRVSREINAQIPSESLQEAAPDPLPHTDDPAYLESFTQWAWYVVDILPTRRSILYQLEDVSAELKEKPLVGEIIELRLETDKLLDLFIDLGYLAVENIESD